MRKLKSPIFDNVEFHSVSNSEDSTSEMGMKKRIVNMILSKCEFDNLKSLKEEKWTYSESLNVVAKVSVKTDENGNSDICDCSSTLGVGYR